MIGVPTILLAFVIALNTKVSFEIPPVYQTSELSLQKRQVTFKHLSHDLRMFRDVQWSRGSNRKIIHLIMYSKIVFTLKNIEFLTLSLEANL